MLQFIILVQLYLCFSLNRLQDFLFMSSFLFFLNVFPHFWSCALKARYAFFPPSIWPACGECAWLPLTDTEASILRRIGGSRICRGRVNQARRITAQDLWRQTAPPCSDSSRLWSQDDHRCEHAMSGGPVL